MASKGFNRWMYALVVTLIFADSKKDKTVPDDQDEIISPTTGNRKEFSLDSIYLYARQVYLWNDALPGYDAFNPPQWYGNLNPDLTAFQTELYDIARLKVNPQTALAYEYPLQTGKVKYSYMFSGIVPGRTVSAAATGNPVRITALVNAGSVKVGYIYISPFPELSLAKTYLDDALHKRRRRLLLI